MSTTECQKQVSAPLLGVEMERICALSNGKGVTMASIFHGLQERGYIAVLLLLSSPFLFPLPTLGLSAPVGIAVMLGGICLILRTSKVWLPQFVMRRHIPHAAIAAISTAVGRVGAWVGRCVRPRLGFVFLPGANALTGLGLVSAGFVLSLPLPIPFTNAIPAAAIILLCLGYLQRDGLVIIAGHGVGLGAWVYLWLVGDAVRAVFEKAVAFFG